MQQETRIGWQGKTLLMMPREELLRTISYIGVLMTMAGVVTAPAILSIGIVVIMLSGLALMPFKEQIRRFWAHKPAVLMSILFLLQLISAFWTRPTDLGFTKVMIGHSSWLEEAKIKVPLFLGMYGLAVLGPFSIRQVRIALGVLLVSTFIVGTGTVVDIFMHREEVFERIQTSKEVEVWLGTNHIYFSIVMAFGILSGIWSLRIKEKLLFRGERIVMGCLVVLNFLEMHFLTTRTGLVGLYLTILIMGLVFLFKRRKYGLAALLILGLMAMPVVGYLTVNSFRLRIENTRYDLKNTLRGFDPNYLSIGTRIESWKTAFHLWKKHPFTGVAMADLKTDMTDQYVEDKTMLCPENFVQPHNQFIQNLAGWGLMGLIAILLAWFYPVFNKKWPKGTLFWAFWLTYTLAMMGESVMERQVGVCFMVPCYMMALGVGAEEKRNALNTQ
jgi:O-antigen ligase